MPVYDLRCTAGHAFIGEFRHRYPDGGAFGPCPCTPAVDGAPCAAPLTQFWTTPDQLRKADGFVTITIGGQRFDTREAWQKHIRQFQRDRPGEEVVVGSVTPAMWRAEAEEVRHELYQDLGVRNEREYANYQAEGMRLKAERANNRNRQRG